jgi:hypothetical protein
MRYPDCNCGARPGVRHSSGCASLTPIPERTAEQRDFDQAWLAADPEKFGSSDDRS